LMNTESTNGSHSPAPAPTRWVVAVHEAAHAAYAHLQGVAVPGVTIAGIVAVENGGERGRGKWLGFCDYDWDGESEGAITGVFRCALLLVASAATHKAGLSEDVLLPYEEFLEAAKGRPRTSDAGKVLVLLDLAKDPEALYEKAREEARVFVEERMREIVALAERLMEKETIGASTISKVLGPGWYEYREMLDEMARMDDLAPWVKQAMEDFGVDDPDRIGTDADGEPILLDW
jgi:hypothetical protein